MSAYCRVHNTNNCLECPMLRIEQVLDKILAEMREQKQNTRAYSLWERIKIWWIGL